MLALAWNVPLAMSYAPTLPSERRFAGTRSHLTTPFVSVTRNEYMR